MLKEYCDTCANLEFNHQANQAESEKYLSMVNEVIASLPQEYAAVLEQILYDWRSHALPVCDPLSVS
jgi:hypothetical protein